MTEFEFGNVVRITATFTMQGSPFDPNTVKFEFKKPGAAQSTEYEYGVNSELQRLSTGVYFVDLDLDLSGPWRYRFFSEGQGKAARPGEFYVKPDPVN